LRLEWIRGFLRTPFVGDDRELAPFQQIIKTSKQEEKKVVAPQSYGDSFHRKHLIGTDLMYSSTWIRHPDLIRFHSFHPFIGA